MNRILRALLPARFHAPRHEGTLALAFALALEGILSVPATGAAEPASVAEFRMRPRLETYLAGEPAVMVLEIANRGAQPLTCRPPTQRAGYLELTIEGSPQAVRSSPRSSDGNVPLVTIPPGAVYRADEVLHFNFASHRLTFPAAARYVVHARYRGLVGPDRNPLDADAVVSIQVTPASEAVGAALFGDLEIARFLVNDHREPGVVARLKALAEGTPSSRYAPYADFWVGQHEMRAYSDKTADYREAARLLARCNRVGFSLRPAALVALAEASAQLGQRALALEYLATLRSIEAPTAAVEAAQAVLQRVMLLPPVAPVPDAGVKGAGAAAVPADNHAAVAACRAFFEAYARRDQAACLALLDDGFEYHDAIGKARMGTELGEEFAKLRQLGSPLSPITRVERFEATVDTSSLGLAVDFMGPASNPVLSAQLDLDLVSRDGRWLLKRWKSPGP